MSTVAISGTGLIGASIGLGLAREGFEVSGWDPNPATLAEAVAAGAVHNAASSLDDLIARQTDVGVLAGPPQAVIDQAASIETDALVLDVAGVKAAVITADRPARFVGTLPMAGR